jgi:hypothetical protein
MLKHALLGMALVQAVMVAPANAAPYSNYSLSGTEYFSLFNYKDSAKHARIRTFERELITHADTIVKYLADHPEYENLRTKHETPIKDLGLILVYTSMFMLNNNNAVLEGVFDAHTFDGLGERYGKAQEYLDFAIQLVPEDDRIHSWAIANQLRKEKVTTGKVSEAVLDRVMELTKKNPIFHLFNALTMSSDYDFGEEREAEILKFTELMDSKDSPCWPPIKFLRRGEAKQCNTTEKTPFAFQGVSTYMGDEFLKTAVKLAATDPEKSKYYAKKALGDYKRLEFFLFKRKTNRWNMKNHIKERIAITEAMLETGKFDPQFFKSQNYLDIYTCTSCHQGGVAPTKLFVNLAQ